MTIEQLIGMAVMALTLFGALWALRSSDKAELARTDGEQDARLRACEDGLRELKDELHTNYPRRDALVEMRNEIRAEFVEVKRDFGGVFDRLNTLATQMARYQGRADARDQGRPGDQGGPPA